MQIEKKVWTRPILEVVLVRTAAALNIGDTPDGLLARRHTSG